MSHWDGPAVVAERLDASVHAVWRVLRREGNLSATATQLVRKHRAKEFAPKAAEVVGIIFELRH